MHPDEIVKLVKEKWLASWAEYCAKNPGSLSPSTLVGHHSYIIEQTVKYTLATLPNLPVERLVTEC